MREAYHAYRAAYDIARHYRDEIVPLRKRIADENLLRYNGMLIGVFELLADARAQIASVNATSRRCATSGSRRPISTWRSSARAEHVAMPSAAARRPPTAAGAAPLNIDEEPTTMFSTTHISFAAPVP